MWVELKRVFIAFCVFLLSDWWKFLYSIMGNVVFTINPTVKHNYFKTN